MTTIGPGDRVECINENWPGFTVETRPTVGGRYTVRDIKFYAVVNVVCLRLVEIVNTPRKYTEVGVVECVFRLACFRPIDERTTDIEIFHEIDREVGRRHYRHIPDEELVT